MYDVRDQNCISCSGFRTQVRSSHISAVHSVTVLLQHHVEQAGCCVNSHAMVLLHKKVATISHCAHS